MSRFFVEGRQHLSEAGRMLISFGTSGDLGYLKALMERAGVTAQVVASADLIRDDWTVECFARRVT